MKFLVSIILTAMLSFVTGLYLSWWGIAAAAFTVSLLIQQGRGRSFLAGFVGLFLLWALLAWRIDSPNNSILSTKIAHILPLGGSVYSLVLLTAFVGALVGGFSGLTASYLKKIFESREKE